MNFALRRLAGVPLTKDFLLSLRGSGWSGDLDAMRDDAPRRFGAPGEPYLAEVSPLRRYR